MHRPYSKSQNLKEMCRSSRQGHCLGWGVMASAVHEVFVHFMDRHLLDQGESKAVPEHAKPPLILFVV
jgi:hypothetical protein